MIPEGSTDSQLDGAVLAAFRIEKGRFALEGGFLYAGLTGEADLPLVKIEVDGFIADLRAGYEVLPNFYLEAGARQISFDVKATVGDYPRQDWEPGITEPLVGLTWRPMLGKRWRLSCTGMRRLVGRQRDADRQRPDRVAGDEAPPHLRGRSATHLSIDKSIEGKEAHLEQTLYGPLLGFGIPF